MAWVTSYSTPSANLGRSAAMRFEDYSFGSIRIDGRSHDHDVELVILPTAVAVEALNEGMEDTNAILHLTC
jgi:hypothetical protein